MSDRIIKTISVPRGGKTDMFFQDAKRAGKNISSLVCGIIERHHTLYDDNILQEMEMNRLRYRYAYVVTAAKEQLNALTGDDWVIHVPSAAEDNSMQQRHPDFIGLETVIHFRKADRDLSSTDS